MATEDPKRAPFSLPEIEVNPDGWGPSRVGYSWVTTQIKPSYTKQARKLSKKKKKPTPPPNPNERQPFHAGLKFRQEISTQRTFVAALGHSQKAQRLHRKRDVAHEQDTVFLTSYTGTNNEIPSPILKRKNWFSYDESRPTLDKNTQGGYVASSPIKKEPKNGIDEPKNIRMFTPIKREQKNDLAVSENCRNNPKKNIHTPEVVSLFRETNLFSKIDLDTKFIVTTPSYEPKRKEEDDPELVSYLVKRNLSTKFNKDTKAKEYDPAYDWNLSQQIKKDNKPLVEMSPSNKVNVNKKTKEPSPKTKKKAKKEKKHGHDLVSSKVDTNLSTKLDEETKTEIFYPNYELAYASYLSQQIKNTKKGEETYPQSVLHLAEMNLSTFDKDMKSAYERYLSQEIKKDAKPFVEMSQSNKVKVDTKNKVPSPKSKKKKNSPEIVTLKREMNLSNKINVDTKNKQPSPKTKEVEMGPSTKVNVDIKTKVPSPKTKKKAKKGKKNNSESVMIKEDINLFTKINVDPKLEVENDTTYECLQIKKKEKKDKNSPELFPFNREMNLSTEINVDTKIKAPSANYKPTFNFKFEKFSFENTDKGEKKKKKAKNYKDASDLKAEYDKYLAKKGIPCNERNSSFMEANGDFIRSIPHFDMRLSMEAIVDTQTKKTPPEYQHTFDYQENKENTEEEENIEEDAKEEDDDYDIVIESITYV